MKKKHLFLFVTFLFLAATSFIGFKIHEYHQEEAIMEAEIAESYRRLHYAIVVLRYNGA